MAHLSLKSYLMLLGDGDGLERPFKGRKGDRLHLTAILTNWAMVVFFAYVSGSFFGSLFFGWGSPFVVSTSPTPTLPIIPTLSPTLTLSPIPAPSPTPTPTPTPTLIPIPAIPTLPPVYAGAYSYYYPPLGGANCHPANWSDERQSCADVTASGLPWTAYIGRGVAIPPSRWDAWRLCVLTVLYPPTIAGDYLIIDVCPACEQGDYLDFLDSAQRLPWTYPVAYYVTCP